MFSLSNSTSSIQIPGYAESQRRKGKVLAAEIKPLRLNSTSTIESKEEEKYNKDDEILEMARALQIEKDKVAKYQRDLLKAQGMVSLVFTRLICLSIRTNFMSSLLARRNGNYF